MAEVPVPRGAAAILSDPLTLFAITWKLFLRALFATGKKQNSQGCVMLTGPLLSWWQLSATLGLLRAAVGIL